MDDKKTATQMPADVCQRLRGDMLERQGIERQNADLNKRHAELTARFNATCEEYAIAGDVKVDFETGAIVRSQVVTPIEQGKKQKQAAK